MSSETTIRRCLDCQSEMRHILLQHPVHYLTDEKQWSIISSYYPHEGKVQAFLCDKCGSIRLFAAPAETTR